MIQTKSEEIGTTFRKIVFGITIAIIAIATILNLYSREGLFLLGINQISSMHQISSSGFIIVVQNLFSMLGNPFIIVPLLVAPYLFVKQRARVFVYLIYALSTLTFMDLLKFIFQESRPFWFSSAIQKYQWFCPVDFGNPSGHSFAIVTLYEPLLTDFIGLSGKKILFWVWTFLVAMVLISRMYLGVHSFDQIILGATLGLSCLLAYRYWLQGHLYQTVMNLLGQRYKKLYFGLTTALWLAYFLFQIFIYQLNSAHRPIDPAFLSNINAACSKEITSQGLQKRALVNGGYIFVALGMVYGFIFLSNYQHTDTMYMCGQWGFVDKKSVVIFAGFLILIVGAPVGILSGLLPAVIPSAIGAYVAYVLGVTWGGIGLVWTMTVIQRRQGLVRYEAEDDRQT